MSRVVGAAKARPNQRRTAVTLVQGDIVEIDGPLHLHIKRLKLTTDFSVFATCFNAATAPKFSYGLAHYFLRFERPTAVNYYQAILLLFNWISQEPRIRNLVMNNSGELAGKCASVWQKVIDTYHDDVLKPKSWAVTTYVEHLGLLYRALDELASLGLSSKCKRPLAPHNYHGTAKHRPSLVELNHVIAPPEVLASIEDTVIKLNIDGGNEVRRLLQALAGRVPESILTDEVAFAEAIFTQNREILESLRGAFEAEYLRWRDYFVQGQQLLLDAPPGIAEDIERICHSTRSERKQVLARIFPKHDGRAATANMLRFIAEVFNGVAPFEKEIHRCLWTVYRQLGGRKVLGSALYLHPQGIAAAALLYITDTGANPSTALNLLLDFEQPTDDAGLVHVDSVKPRAGPDPIVKVLPINDPTVKVTAVAALRGVREMTLKRQQHPKAKGITSEDLDHLLIHASPLGLMRPNCLHLANAMKRIVRDANQSKNFSLSAIRASFAVDQSNRPNARGDLSTLGRLLNHSSKGNTTSIYALSWPVRLLLTKKMREFQEIFQIASASGVPGALVKLGYEQAIEADQIAKAHRTGLGFLCSDPIAGHMEGTVAGSNCTKVGKCTKCVARIFLVDETSLAEAIATNRLLSERQQEMEATQSHKWETVWIELFAFTEVVIEKVQQSHFAYLLPTALQKAMNMISQGFNPLLAKP